MTQVISDRRDIEFVLYEQLGIEALLGSEAYAGFTRKMFDMVISEARTLAVKEILPTYAQGDREGVAFDKGAVRVPECFRRPYKLFAEGEWIGLTKSQAFGGQGLPHVIAQAVSEYLFGANYALLTYSVLANGTGKMIELFGTEAQKKLFLKKLYTGRWAGTMLLTEPEAGSDVGNLSTSAVKNPDGTYTLTGTKIFITNGEQDLTENIIHPVLARIEGAPKGTKGISLFLVPKIWVRPDGSLGEPNDVVCTGVEEKMGIHASPTCSMALGAKGGCRGLLLGKENRGMEIMFHMMNEARLEVGTQGLAQASAAYLYALDYARQRLQGRDPDRAGDPDAPSVPIIRHPDVRRMLLWMKAHVEGMRSLICYVAYGFDRACCAAKNAEKNGYDHLISLLTPVVKAYCSERGFDVCVQAMQVFGGYGYTRDYPIEQLVRDCKIASIYEGTDGIQAMDLLGRKLGMKNGAAFKAFVTEIRDVIALARETKSLEPMALRVEKAVRELEILAVHMGTLASSADFRTAFAFAHPFLEVMGDVTMAWMHLWRAAVAAPKLAKIVGEADEAGQKKIIGKNKNAAFYEGQVRTASYFINAILPITMGRMKAIYNSNKSVTEIDERSFGI